MAAAGSDVTRLLGALGEVGPRSAAPRAADAHFAVVYDELRRLAESLLAHEVPGQTLSPTALVHEAYLRLLEEDGRRWADRAYFFGTAACAMRRILVERARQKARPKHGGGRGRMPVDGLDLAAAEPPVDVLALDEELSALERADARAYQVVMLRIFAGLSVEAAAELIGLSSATVKREWSYARAWLNDRLEGVDQEGGAGHGEAGSDGADDT